MLLPAYAGDIRFYNTTIRMLRQKIPGRKMPNIFAEMSETHRQPVIDIFNYLITATHAAFLNKAVAYSFFDHFLKLSHGYPAVVQAAV